MTGEGEFGRLVLRQRRRAKGMSLLKEVMA
jgi:hypothetical protein